MLRYDNLTYGELGDTHQKCSVLHQLNQYISQALLSLNLSYWLRAPLFHLLTLDLNVPYINLLVYYFLLHLVH